MKCPACDRELTEVKVGAVAVDVCQGGCGGIWFDAFELQRVDEERETAGNPLMHIQTDPNLHVDLARKRDCPRCDGVKLKRHFFSARRSVEVDHCPNCAGYWLDAGELAKVRQEKKAADSGKSPPAGYVNTEVIRYIYRMRIETRAQL